MSSKSERGPGASFLGLFSVVLCSGWLWGERVSGGLSGVDASVVVRVGGNGLSGDDLEEL